MFCPECGTKNEDDARFCGECGTSLQEYWQSDKNQHDEQPYDFNQKEMPKEQFKIQQNMRQYQEQPVLQQAGSKSMSKKNILLIAEVILAIVLVIGIYSIMNRKFMPETIAMDYWESVMAQEWSKAYDYCDFPDNDFLTKQIYVNVNASQPEPIPYKSAKIKSTEGILQNSDTRSLVVGYIPKGSSEIEYSDITLTKTGKKQFLLWDEWKVTPSNVWCKDAAFTIPAQASMTLNDVEVKGTSEPAGEFKRMQTITIPYLFLGSYQMEITEEGMEPFRKIITINNYGCEDNYINLMPSEDTKAALVEQFGVDLKKIMESALAEKNFSEVQDCFSKSARIEEDIQYNYEELFQLKRDKEIVSLDIKNIRASVEDDTEGSVIHLNVKMDSCAIYPSYWRDELETDNKTLELHVYYIREDDTWKLLKMPVSYNTF